MVLILVKKKKLKSREFKCQCIALPLQVSDLLTYIVQFFNPGEFA